MITRIVRLANLCAFLALLSLPASGQSAPAQPEWIKALRDGGYVIIFRHGATYQDQADTDPLNPKNVLKQRQLNDEGRALAKSIGESLHKLRIPVGQVHTSLFQRAIDTGALMGFGDVKVSADYTEGGLVVTPIENNRRTAALRKMAGTMPPARHQCHRRHAQTEHRGCFRQRLVRRSRRRSIGVQAGRQRRLQTDRPDPGR